MFVEVILNSPVRNLGRIGDLVKVKAGYARNFLVPRKIAITASAQNKKRFEEKRALLLKEHEKKLENAKRLKKECDHQWLSIVKNTNYDGSLYGAVSDHDIYLAMKEYFNDIEKDVVKMNKKIRRVGIYDIVLNIYDDVNFNIKVNIAGSFAEAEKNKQDYIDRQMKLDAEKKSAETREKFSKKNIDNSEKK